MLKNKLIFLMHFLLMAAANAADVAKIDQSKKSPAMSERHIFAAVLFSGANQIIYTGDLDLFGSPTPFTAKEETTGAAGFSVGYLSRRTGSIGYSGEFIYELPRPSKGLSGTAGNLIVQGTYDGNPTKSLLTAAGNVNYSLGSRTYIFAGLNYPLVFSGEGGQSFSGLPGYQGGVGFSFTERISAEMGYRTLRLKGSIESPSLNLEIREATFSGALLAVHYLF